MASLSPNYCPETITTGVLWAYQESSPLWSKRKVETTTEGLQELDGMVLQGELRLIQQYLKEEFEFVVTTKPGRAKSTISH